MVRIVAVAIVAFGVVGMVGCEPERTVSTDDGDEDDVDPRDGQEGEGDCGADDRDCDGATADVDCNDLDSSIGSFEDDNDCDGVPWNLDCDDFNSSVGSQSADDQDCDGVTIDQDCNDNDAFVGSFLFDNDCDGAQIGDDCDDGDPSVGYNFDDEDCDGITWDVDCDDFNPAIGSYVLDNDCDGVPTDQDCNDFDWNMGSVANDQDCDGVGTDLDCDDLDATRGDRGYDADCDGVYYYEDCDDADATVGYSTFDDADCDGVTYENDCYDYDRTVGDIRFDHDCDRAVSDDDCDDENFSVGSRAFDADCDGVRVELDCDDDDVFYGDVSYDQDCDGVLYFEDCDDFDATRGAQTVADFDCDGVDSGDDCDDGDENLGTIAADLDCDGAGNDLEVRCGSDANDAGSLPDDLDGDDTCDGLDDDADGDGVDVAGDCDDRDAAVNPGAAEVDLDGKDNDCDGDYARDVVFRAELTTGGAIAELFTTGALHVAVRGAMLDLYDGPLAAPTFIRTVALPDAASAIAATFANDTAEVLYVRARETAELFVVDVTEPAEARVLQRAPALLAGELIADDARDRVLARNGSGALTLHADGTFTGDVVSLGIDDLAPLDVVPVSAGLLVATHEGAVLVDDDVRSSAAIEGTGGRWVLDAADAGIAYLVREDAVASLDLASFAVLDVVTEEQGVAIGGSDGVVADGTLAVFASSTAITIDVSDPSALAVVGTQPAIAEVTSSSGDTLVLRTAPTPSLVQLGAQGLSEPVALDAVASRAVTFALPEVDRVWLDAPAEVATSLAAHDLAVLGGPFAPDDSGVDGAVLQPQTLDTQSTHFAMPDVDAPAALVDLSGDDAALDPLDSPSSFGTARAIATSQTRAIVATSFFATTVATFDADDGAFLGEADPGFTVVGAALAHDTMFLASADGTVRAFPSATPNNVGAARAVPVVGAVQALLGRGDLLFHATRQGFFGARSVADPNAPGAVHGVLVGGSADAFSVDGDRAYVSVQCDGAFACLAVVDVSNPSAPALVAVRRGPRGTIEGAPLAGGTLVAMIVDGAAVFFSDTSR